MNVDLRQNTIAPTLTYPVGGESLTHETMQITWENPDVFGIEDTSLLEWYEVLFSLDTANEDNRLWRKIADVPISVKAFDWTIPHGIKNNNCRIGVRILYSDGIGGPISMSSASFSVQNKKLPAPAVVSPTGGESFFTYIPIIFDQGGLEGQFPKRSHYRVSYSSSSQEIDWICIGDNISITTSETYLDVSALPAAGDYSLKFELIDGEDSSPPVFIHNITINNLNFFKIDTVPPTGVIKVRNNTEYIKNRDVVLELTSYDATSGTESFRIIQKQQGVEEPEATSPLYPMSDMNSWRIVGDDGVKFIQSSFVDYAGNALESTSDEFFFRTFKSVDNREITSLLVSKNGSVYEIWQAVGGINPELYKDGISVIGAEATGTASYLPASTYGTSLDYEQRYDINGLDSIDVTFSTGQIADRLVIDSGAGILKDTGLITGETSFNLVVVGLSEITVKITSPYAGTGWNYEIDSKDEYPSNSDYFSTAASKDKPEGEILSMAKYNDVLYLGEQTKDAKGLLQRYTGGHIESVFSVNPITSLDSSINSMIVFDDRLFMACQNGELYSFNGSSVTLENTFISALNKIGTDGNLLYIFLENSSDIYTAYKDTVGELVYVKTTLE